MSSEPVLYVLKRFPRVSETFVLRELLELETQEVEVLVDSLLPAETGPAHPELARLRAKVRYLPQRLRLWQPGVARAHVQLFFRGPVTWSGLAWRALGRHGWRAFLQSGLVASRARATGVGHLHAHFATSAAEVAAGAGALARLPVTVTAHAKDIYQVDHARALARRLAGVTAVVTVSEFNARHLRALLPDLPVHHVPNGMEAVGPASPPAGGAVLCVSRLVEKKGVDVLVEATAIASRDLPDLRVEVAGDGPLAGELRASAHRLGLSQRIRFLGAVTSDEVDRRLRDCSLFALPCRVASDGDRDGMPTVLLEAMVRAVPVISTSIGGIPELVRDGETGVLIPPDDPKALAAAIVRLWRQPALARRLGLSAREYVLANHDPSRTVARLRAVFAAQP